MPPIRQDPPGSPGNPFPPGPGNPPPPQPAEEQAPVEAPAKEETPEK